MCSSHKYLNLLEFKNSFFSFCTGLCDAHMFLADVKKEYPKTTQLFITHPVQCKIYRQDNIAINSLSSSSKYQFSGCLQSYLKIARKLKFK